jgi:class 3 adenylate cyclase/TolB-like protein
MARDQRRLAAIVSADVAGYSRLMGRDEGGTLAALKAHRRDLIDPKIAEYGGRIVKTTGDGLLLEFPSVVDAVRCAVDVQRGMALRNGEVAHDQRIDFRIGVNVGDIIIDGDDIYGDGVNVAARLQTLAEPGEIYVSKVVRDQVLDKLNFAFEDLGAQKVKNIARPVEAFRVDLGAAAFPTASSHKLVWHRLTRSRSSKWMGVAVVLVTVAGIAFWTLTHRWEAASVDQSASSAVAVLPFAAGEDSLEEQHLADTITRDLTSMLGRGARTFSVVSQDFTAPYKGKAIDPRAVGRNLGALYLVEGEVRRVGARTEVNVQLLETAAATQLWSDRVVVDERERNTRPDKLVALLQDRIGWSIFTANMRRFAGPPTRKAGPFELTMHAWAVWYRDNNTVRGAREARKWFDKALLVDPNFVAAITGRWRTLYYELEFEPNVDKKRVLKDLDQLSFLGINIDSSNPIAWGVRAESLVREGRWDAALEANAKAEKLSSPDNGILAQRADIMVSTGRPEEALALADRALTFDPVYQEQMGWIMLQRCRAFMALGRYDEAIDSCERNVALDNWWRPHLYLVAAYAMKGETERAATEKATLLDLRPSASIADYKRYTYSDNPAFVQQTETHLLAGLRKAGLPEQ